MFSGIVVGQGRIVDLAERGGDRRVVISRAGVDLGEIAPGDSIAVNGVCLTAIDPDAETFAADVSAETLKCTTLGGLGVGAAVNLEGSLRVGDTIDGHLVYGHVDGVGEIVEMHDEARSVAVTIAAPERLARYIAVKGSVSVDGVSLTVNAVESNRFVVNIIPHTREITVIAGYRSGTPVNIEADIIARYVERLVNLNRHGIIESH